MFLGTIITNIIYVYIYTHIERHEMNFSAALGLGSFLHLRHCKKGTAMVQARRQALEDSISGLPWVDQLLPLGAFSRHRFQDGLLEAS